MDKPALHNDNADDTEPQVILVSVTEHAPSRLIGAANLTADEASEIITTWLNTPFVLAKQDALALYGLFGIAPEGSDGRLPEPAEPVITDAQIIDMFSDTRFGLIDGKVDMQRYFLARACLKSLAGWWNGYTIFRIMVWQGLVSDTSPAQVTEKGMRFLQQSFTSLRP